MDRAPTEGWKPAEMAPQQASEGTDEAPVAFNVSANRGLCQEVLALVLVAVEEKAVAAYQAALTEGQGLARELVQGIYSWRGADIRYLAQFRQDYPEAREIALEQNYRSSGTILRLANALSSGLEYGRRRLWTENPQGGPAFYHLAEDEHGEARFVVREVQRLLEQGHLPSDCAVLYRTRAQARVLEAALLEAGRGEMEEELRVLYVAVTRARERLYLARARTRQVNGRRMDHPPSRFLRLLPPGCLRGH